MSTTPNAPFGFGRAPLVDSNGNPNRPFLKFLQTIATQTTNALTQIGILKSTVQIQGQSGTLGGKVQNLDGTGVMTAPGVDFSRNYVNQNLDNIPNGNTYHRILGAELDLSGRLAPLQQSYINTSTGAILAQVGTSPTISVAAFSNINGLSPIAYNAGTVTAPSNTSTGYVYASDPNNQGGAVAYQFTANYSTVLSSQGNVMVGKITLSAGGGGSGGGQGGSNSNVCFHPNVRLINGDKIFSIVEGQYVFTLHGFRTVKHVIHRNYEGNLVHMGNDEWVTEGHHFVVGGQLKTAGELWAEKKHYSGLVCNLEIDTIREDERNYFLANGMLSHNMIPVGC